MTLFKAAPLLQMGFRTMRKLSANQFTRTSVDLVGLPVIILPLETNQESKPHGKDVGADANLGEPLNLNKIKYQLSKFPHLI